MSAEMVCGKRCYFEEEWESLPLVITKKLRLTSSQIERLMEVFPNIPKQRLEKALQENDNDVDSVIKSFNQLCLGHVDGNSGLSNAAAATSEEYAENSSAHGNIPVTNCLQQQNEALMWENVALKEQQQQTEALMKEQQQQIEALMRENVALKEKEKENVALKEQNTILKRGVVIQYERQKDYDNRIQEVEHLKKLVSKLVSTYEVKIYALTKQQAQEGSSMPERYHPDVC